ncbi:hypothetical protein HB848_08240 [Listeria rocourtiae]|uniref:hypothetical protein n=1 Tax=Listeria rocourtiae TaxID=647910 RepID=UPI0016293073|nr:hypothetical protein [Listeria rocourtiae]MBC1435328.1 hypothetical protein [Listeria rocourtiae]
MSNKFLYEVLTKYQQQGNLVAIYVAQDMNVFELGYIEAVTDYDVLFRSERADGYSEGLVVTSLALISQIEAENDYLRAVTLMQNDKGSQRKEAFLETVPKRKHSLMAIASNYLEQTKRVCFVEVLGGESVVMGVFQEELEEGICLRNVTEEGRYDGYTWLKKEDITALRWDGTRENEIEKKLK